MRFTKSFYFLLIPFTGITYLQTNSQKKTFELSYTYAGKGSNSHSIFPAFHVKKGMYYLTMEQNGFMSNTETRKKPDTILLGNFRKSSEDSILNIVDKIKKLKVYKTNPGIMSGGIHFINISSPLKVIEFELDNASDRNAEKIIDILNSYIYNKENKLWLFRKY